MKAIARSITLAVAFGLLYGLAPALAEPGMQPSLESRIEPTDEPPITPIMDLDPNFQPRESSAPAVEAPANAKVKAEPDKQPVKVKAEPEKPAVKAKAELAKPAAQAKAEPEEPASKPSASQDTPEAAPHEKPAVLSQFKALLSPLSTKPVSYTPLPAIAIFPVIKHGKEKAFGDLPLIFAREYALRMELKAPETKVYHPIYTVDEIRLRGLGHVYDQIMNYYLKAGRPEPKALDYLLKHLTGEGKPVARVFFVEADLDTSHPDAATSVTERLNAFFTDGMPKQMKYFVRSRLQVFDAENPEFPMVWAGSWARSVKANRFYNVTPSVFDDSDSQQAFSRASRDISREFLYVMPKEVYMIPQYDTAVQGKLVSEKEAPFPNLTETGSSSAETLSDENKKAIQRILQRQNAISP